jgi:hypothetical protein
MIKENIEEDSNEERSRSSSLSKDDLQTSVNNFINAINQHIQNKKIKIWWEIQQSRGKFIKTKSYSFHHKLQEIIERNSMKITRSKSESFYHSWDYSPTIKSFIKSNEKIENNNQNKEVNSTKKNHEEKKKTTYSKT